ncbi:MAG: caspase family protein [Hyphomonadaceae bacterium]
MIRFLLALLGVFLTIGTQALGQETEPRLALVIEQTAYSGDLSRIELASREADLISGALEQTGFEVRRVANLRKVQLEVALDTFRLELEGAGPEAVGFIYYTGHGVQNPETRDSYLLGTKARLRGASDLAIYGVDMQTQLDGFAATGAKAVFVVFDACRNTPAIRGWKTRTKGIARVEVGTDMLVAYATGLDDVAAEGVYAPVLSEEIVRPEQTAGEAFSAAQIRVANATGRGQLPWTNNLLYNEFCFAGCTGRSRNLGTSHELTGAAQPNDDGIIVPSDISEYEHENEDGYWNKISDDEWASLGGMELLDRYFSFSTSDVLLAEAESGDRDAQAFIGIVYNNGRSPWFRYDYDKAEYFLRLSCAQDHKRACGALGGAIRHPARATHEKRVEGFNLVKEACDEGLPIFCWATAWELASGEVVERDLDAARFYAGGSCENGSVAGCDLLEDLER